ILILAGTCAYSQGLVRLDAIATTSKGEPVTDLKIDELRVREDGKLRPIVFLRRPVPAAAAEMLAPGEYANRAQPAPTLILLDRWNERLLTAASAVGDLASTVQHMESMSNVYIYILNNHGELVPVRPVPNPESDMRPVFEATPAQVAADLDAAVKKMQGFRDVDSVDPIYRANLTFQAMELIGQRLASFSGRKNLVWVTHGFPISVRLPGQDWQDLTPAVRNYCELAAQSEIAIYAVDQSGAGSGADVSSVSRETLEKFAQYTGGRWYPSGNTTAAVAEAQSDA